MANVESSSSPPSGPRPRPRLLSLVLPLYDEEEVFPELKRRVEEMLARIDVPAEVVLVDDGSRDRTRLRIEEWAAADARVKGICLARNFGHQAALTAGMDHAEGEAVVILDADLQDPPEVIPDMIEKYAQGYDVVYGRRTGREGESWFKRWSAHVFYRAMRLLVHRELPADVGDFRLMSRAVVDELKAMREQHRFLRGMVTWLGFAQTEVPYTRPKRPAGETKYTLRKMLALAWNASVSFSPLPLRISLLSGAAIAGFGVCYTIYALVHALVLRDTVPGWTTLVVLLCLIGGWILISIGILGEYVARIFEEVKGRPLYVVRKKLNGGPK